MKAAEVFNSLNCAFLHRLYEASELTADCLTALRTTGSDGGFFVIRWKQTEAEVPRVVYILKS